MQITWQYVAGFFDGEGSISITHRKADGGMTLVVSISQSSGDGQPPAVLVDISDFISKHDIIHNISCGAKYQKKTNLTNGNEIIPNRTVFNLQIQNRKGILTFLGGIRPYVRVKKVKCDDVLRFYILYPLSLTGKCQPTKFDRIDPLAVRADLDGGMTWKAVAKKYQTTLSTISKCLNPQARVDYWKEYRRKKRVSAQETLHGCLQISRERTQSRHLH